MTVRQEGNGRENIMQCEIKRPEVVSRSHDSPVPLTCPIEDGSRSPGTTMQVEVPNHRKLLFHNGNGSERYGKRSHVMRSGE